MKRVYIKRFLEFIIFAIIFIALLNITSRLFVPKWITESYSNEKNMVDSFIVLPKNSIDIIFVGSSDMYDAVSPMELWNDYGYTSYNYSFPGSRVWLSYYNIKSVFERQNPKYLFLLVDDIFYDGPATNGNVAKTITTMPLSKTKIETLFNSDVQRLLPVRISYFFPIIRFHSRYNELNKTDFKYMFNKAYYPLKGFVPCSGVKPYKNTNEYLNNKKKVQSIPTKNIKYLNKIKGLCNEKNTELILIEMPSTDTWTHKRHKSVQEYADKNNLTFIDLNYLLDKVGINWNTDTKDKGNHLNTLGAMKITKYMGEYIKNNLNVTDHRNELEYNMWNKDYVEYLKLRDESLNEIYKKINK